MIFFFHNSDAVCISVVLYKKQNTHCNIFGKGLFGVITALGKELKSSPSSIRLLIVDLEFLTWRVRKL